MRDYPEFQFLELFPDLDLDELLDVVCQFLLELFHLVFKDLFVVSRASSDFLA